MIFQEVTGSVAIHVSAQGKSCPKIDFFSLFCDRKNATKGGNCVASLGIFLDGNSKVIVEYPTNHPGREFLIYQCLFMKGY